MCFLLVVPYCISFNILCTMCVAGHCHQHTDLQPTSPLLTHQASRTLQQVADSQDQALRIYAKILPRKNFNFSFMNLCSQFPKIDTVRLVNFMYPCLGNLSFRPAIVTEYVYLYLSCCSFTSFVMFTFTGTFVF